jgi:hypothetical protein
MITARLSPGHALPAAAGQFGHHRAQPLGIQPLCQEHRSHDVGEQNGDLFALTGFGGTGDGLGNLGLGFKPRAA